MKIKSVVLIGLSVAIVSALAHLILNHPQAPDAASAPKRQNVTDAVTRVILPRQPAASGIEKASETQPSQKATPGNENPADTAQKTLVNGSSKEPLNDPIAREALSLVGLDPEAEAYWFEAINDLSLPPNERQDLIEDLNEEGLSDPKHPTINDLPLILSRLDLIEAIGPDAADEVNADAFDEAYKDLLNLAELAMGGGEPVK